MPFSPPRQITETDDDRNKRGNRRRIPHQEQGTRRDVTEQPRQGDAALRQIEFSHSSFILFCFILSARLAQMRVGVCIRNREVKEPPPGS